MRLDRLEAVVQAIEKLLGGPVRIWRVEHEKASLVAGAQTGSLPKVTSKGLVAGDGRTARAIPNTDGYYYECGCERDTSAPDEEVVGNLFAQILAAERDTLGVAEELAGRYEEIDLLYTISDILGRTIRLEEAAEVIVREVSSVVGSRRASIFVYNPEDKLLRAVAGWGIDIKEFGPIPLDHETSIAAIAFRERKAIAGEADKFDTYQRPARRQAYRGMAFLSVPIIYPDAEGNPRPVGVINLTDRLGADRFSSGHRKLVEAIAHQIGATIENARLVTLERERQRVSQEMQLAHDLQLRILPSPSILQTDLDVAARCSPGELVGGDFYQFIPILGDRVGVMLGDVSTHGFPAALIMALVLSAAAIHGAAADSPEDALTRLLASVRSELSTTEMYLSLFYGVVDPQKGTLSFANAGHPHAFIVRPDGDASRLEATAPPLGLGDLGTLAGATVPFRADRDLLVIFSDGIADAGVHSGRKFGEHGVLEVVRDQWHSTATDMVNAVFTAVGRYDEVARDDQTLLVLKA